ncbi:group II intron reverse transcriptase/maturase [compost metagenome]
MQVIELLTAAFPISDREALLLIRTAPRRYKVHAIEKRNGRGKRIIAQPTAELKAIQKFLMGTLLRGLPIHPAAMAYRPKIGIRNHAELHAAKKYLLKLDFENFFPSIRVEDFQKHLALYSKLNEDDVRAVSRLLFRYEKQVGALILSIGAPSSPFVSNTIMYEFDSIVAEYCSSRSITYSRYADDLAFSTDVPHQLDRVQNFVRLLCEKIVFPRLRLNEEKTVFTSKKFQRQLTGLTLTNDGKVSLGREKKREIRSMAHHFSLGRLDAPQIGKLRGLLSFSLSIEPDFSVSIQRMLGDVKYRLLMMGLN